MSSLLREPPTGGEHFEALKAMLASRQPFTFVRFSDGEMEILRNERLIIGEAVVEWRKGVQRHAYPLHDRKTFEPELHGRVREDLLTSASFTHPQYIKGVPATHNRAVDDRDLMVDLNGGLLDNLSFADLFLNENYRRFMREVVPLFFGFRDVTILGNFRMRPDLMDPRWNLIPIPDDFFSQYGGVKEKVMGSLRAVPKDSLILASASSLSNITGAELLDMRTDITFIDVGTTLHSRMSMGGRSRTYHVDLEPWRVSNAHKKIRNRLSRDYRLVW